MKSNMVFLAPLLAGIVVGLSSMIVLILNKLMNFKEVVSSGETTTGISSGIFGSITKMFDITSMIPPYYIQVSIGIYIVEIIFILTSALVTINSGKDVLREKNELAKNLKKGITLYLITAFVAIVALTLLAGMALSSL